MLARIYKRRRNASTVLLALLGTVCALLIGFHNETMSASLMTTRSGWRGSTSNRRTHRSMQRKKCSGKETIMELLQDAVTSNTGSGRTTPCKVSALMASRQLKRRTKHIYGSTTCELSDMCDQLPKQKQVKHVYGEEPIILGMETCSKNLLPRVAGLYNSGTNLLSNTLKDLFPTQIGTDQDGEVPWGKHRPPKTRIVTEDKNDVLPIVIVRDPFRWMASMCKTNYDVTWTRVPHKHCPNLVPIEKDWDTKLRKKQRGISTYNVTVDARKSSTASSVEKYDSLADMWTSFYSQYDNAAFPRLIVRMEDLIFHQVAVLEQISLCVTGHAHTTTIPYQVFSSKTHGRSTDLVSAVINYGTSRGRYAGMDAKDLRYAATALDPHLMKRFGYLAVPKV